MPGGALGRNELVITVTLNAVMSANTTAKLNEKTEACELVKLARERGLSPTGPGGLLQLLTKAVIETALDEELTEHLGCEKHDTAVKHTGNARNGTRSKTMLTESSGPGWARTCSSTPSVFTLPADPSLRSAGMPPPTPRPRWCARKRQADEPGPRPKCRIANARKSPKPPS